MPLPFAFLGLGSLASTLLTGAAIAGTGYVAKKVYDAVTDEDSTTTSTKTGPSEEEVKKKERAKVYAEVKANTVDFMRVHPQILCVKDDADVARLRALSEKLLLGEISLADANSQKQVSSIDKEFLQNSYIQWKRIDGMLNAVEGLSCRKNTTDPLIRMLSLIIVGTSKQQKQNLEVTQGEKTASVIAWDLLELVNECIASSSPRLALEQDLELREKVYIVGTLWNTITKALDNGQYPELPVSLLQRYPAIEQQWNTYAALKNAQDNAKEAHIVVCGLLKAGKSMLLNMLTNTLETELFATKATRATTKNQSAVVDGLCFVDTPGLDAPGEQGAADSEAAEQAYLAADVLLFVHAVERELTDLECQTFKRLHIQGAALEQKILMVLTHAEELGDEEAQKRMRSKVQEQLKEHVGLDIPLFLVGNKTYQRGVLEDKEALRHLGGVDRLRDELVRLRDSELATANNARKEKIDSIAATLCSLLNEKKKKLSRDVTQEQENFQDIITKFYADVVKPGKDKLAQYS